MDYINWFRRRGNPIQLNLVRYKKSLGWEANICTDSFLLLDLCTNKDFMLDVHRDGMYNYINIVSQNEATQQHIGWNLNVSSKDRRSRFLIEFDMVSKIILDIKKLTAVNKLGKFHDGKIFLCRTIAPAFQLTSTYLLVEDPEGQQAVRLSLYNYTTSRGQAVQTMIPMGTILAIKNPRFKATLDGGFSLRCDNPSDVMIISAKKLAKKFPKLEWGGNMPLEYWAKHTSTDLPLGIIGSILFVIMVISVISIIMIIY